VARRIRAPAHDALDRFALAVDRDRAIGYTLTGGDRALRLPPDRVQRKSFE